VQTHTWPAVQTQLTVSEPGDQYEEEADEVAEQVMRQINTSSNRPLDSSQPLQPEEMPAEDEAHGPIIQRQATGPAVVAPEVEATIQGERGSGQSLPAGVAAYMGSALGADFSRVRVHTDAKADSLSHTLQARAFTTRQDIFFRQGEYRPDHSRGQALIAHELTHVVQQADRAVQRQAEGQAVRSLTCPSIQRFGVEHRDIGDTAAGPMADVILARTETEQYTITPGELSFCADFFTNVAEMRTKASEYLQSGGALGPTDEIAYVLQVKLKQSATDDDFADNTVEAVKTRYVRLAAGNIHHFSRPGEGTRARSNATVYREAHEKAIELAHAAANRWVAVDLGREATIEDAMASEAFGSHFLQDMFPAGHIRTPRASAQEHWDTLYPNFSHNLRLWLGEVIYSSMRNYAQGGAAGIAVLGTLLGAGVITIPIGIILSDQAQNIIDWVLEKKLSDLPPTTLGGMLGAAMHDYDNAMGLWAISELGPEDQTPFLFKASGEGATLTDEHGKSVDATIDLARTATAAGRGEVSDAFNQAQGGADFESIKAAFQIAGPQADGVSYLPERYRPREATAEEIQTLAPEAYQGQTNHQYDWELNSIDEVTAESNLGRAIALSVRSVIIPGLQDLASSMGISFLLNEVISRLNSQPLETVKSVANYVPAERDFGWFAHNEDDQALEYYQYMEQQGWLGQLPLPTKVDLVRRMSGGVWAAGDEEQAILRVLEANTGDASEIISQVGYMRLHDAIDDENNYTFVNQYAAPDYFPSASLQDLMGIMQELSAGRTNSEDQNAMIKILLARSPQERRQIIDHIGEGSINFDLTGDYQDQFDAMDKGPVAPYRPIVDQPGGPPEDISGGYGVSGGYGGGSGGYDISGGGD
jgi:hypothetical protein